MRLIIDGDALVYRAGFASERHSYQGVVETPTGDTDTFHQPAGPMMTAFTAQQEALGNKIIFKEKLVDPEPVGYALQAVNLVIHKIVDEIRKAGHDDIQTVILLTGPDNFRERLATIRPYKGNRDPSHKPVHYQALRDYLTGRLGARVIHGREADDEVSILARQARREGAVYCVATIDKDLDQIPGLHYDYRQHVFYTVSEEDAERALWIQALAGDSGDNVPGCYGVGLGRATKAIDQMLAVPGVLPLDIWEYIVAIYAESQTKEGCPYKDKDPEDVALETARLVYLQRFPGEVWYPTGPRVDEENAGVQFDD